MEPDLDIEIFHFRQNMRERTKEYRKELEEMQLRVKNRPYLFEQVSKVTGTKVPSVWVTGHIVFHLRQALRNLS